jgi:hypothetical protein
MTVKEYELRRELASAQLTSEKEVLPVALAARTRSPTDTSEIAFTAPDSRKMVSDPAKQELANGDPLSGTTEGASVGNDVLEDGAGFAEGVTVGDDAVGITAGADEGADVGDDAVGITAGADEGADVGDDAVRITAGADEGADVGDDAVGDGAGFAEGVTVDDDTVGGTAGVDEGASVVSSVVAAGALTDAVKPFDSPTVLRAVVSDVIELVRAVVVSACVSCVSTSYITLTEDDEVNSLNPFLIKLRLRLTVIGVIDVIVIAFGSRPRAVAVAEIKAAWNELSVA